MKFEKKCIVYDHQLPNHHRKPQWAIEYVQLIFSRIFLLKAEKNAGENLVNISGWFGSDDLFAVLFLGNFHVWFAFFLWKTRLQSTW